MMTFIRGITGVEFYQNRSELDRVRTLTEELGRAKEVYAYWVAGRRQFQVGENLNNIKRLILPDPNSASIAYFEQCLPDGMNLRDQIREVTAKAIDRGISVRWHPEFCGHSWWVANPTGQDASAFVHLEIVMPHARREHRPSIRVYRKRHGDAFAELLNVYEEMWTKSEKPNGTRLSCFSA